MLFKVSCSEDADQHEGAIQIVTREDLRSTVHALFCCCGKPEACTNGYVADFDDYSEEEICEGGHWDLEDGWVKFEPLRGEHLIIAESEMPL